MRSKPSRREVVKAGSLSLLGAGAVGSSILGLGAPSRSAAAISGAYQNNVYTLGPLPYGYDALEPLYDERTVTIHHTKHHAGYVNGLNSTLAKLEAARASGDYSAIKALSRVRLRRINGSGHPPQADCLALDESRSAGGGPKGLSQAMAAPTPAKYKHEIRISKLETTTNTPMAQIQNGLCVSSLEHSCLFRISIFGFRILRCVRLRRIDPPMAESEASSRFEAGLDLRAGQFASAGGGSAAIQRALRVPSARTSWAV